MYLKTWPYLMMVHQNILFNAMLIIRVEPTQRNAWIWLASELSQQRLSHLVCEFGE